MFTGDLFGWNSRSDFDAPWHLSDSNDADAADQDYVVDYLIHNRYWWLAGADTSSLRRILADTFEKYPVEILAPDHGCVLSGPSVPQQCALLDSVLEIVGRLEPVGLAAGRWPVTSSERASES
jgi:hypothetical protein